MILFMFVQMLFCSSLVQTLPLLELEIIYAVGHSIQLPLSSLRQPSCKKKMQLSYSKKQCLSLQSTILYTGFLVKLSEHSQVSCAKTNKCLPEMVHKHSSSSNVNLHAQIIQGIMSARIKISIHR